MEKSPIKKNYWAVLQDKKILFDGSFNECWSHLVRQYKNKTLGEIEALHIFIGRIN